MKSEDMTLQTEPVVPVAVINEPQPLYTKDLSDKFFEELKNISTRLNTTSHVILSVMMSESGVRANAHNPNGNASGLIQFMPKTLLNLGWTLGHAVFRRLDALEQLPFVEKYFSSYKGHIGTVAGCYVATFLPALVSHAQDKNYVLCAKEGQLGWAYGPNAVFDSNRDGKITVDELEKAVIRNCVGSRWEQIRARSSGQGVKTPNISTRPDLGTIYGMQRALKTLGFYTGEVDGVYGPLSRQALVEFQTVCHLVPDGIYGPLSREKLEKESK